MCDKKLMVEEKKLKNDEEVTGYGFEVDIWSCGVVLYALLYGNFPFKGVSVRDIKLEVLTGNLMLKKNISESAQDLLKNMLERDVDKRFTLKQIFKHSWLKDHKKPTRIFNQTERELISSEFIFMPGETDKDNATQGLFSNNNGQKKINEMAMPAKSPDFIPMKSELFEFTYHNLQSTQGSGAANITGKSDMLAPFNSSCGPNDERALAEYRQMQNEYKMFPMKDDILVFEAKAKVYDIKYERDYNQNQDNGVLLESEEKQLDITPDPDVTRNMSAMGQSRGQTTDSDKTNTRISKRKNKDNDGSIMIDSFRPDWKSPREQEMGLKTKEEFDAYHPPFPIKPEVVHELVKIGFTLEHVIESLSNNHANHCSATYYLYDKDQSSIL